jgi:hypothetical protein
MTVFAQTRAFYRELEKRSEVNENDELIYTGFITQLPQVLGISPSMYHKLRSILIQSDCIVFMKRGGRGEPSTIQLLQPPTEDGVESALKDLTYRPGAARVRDMEERLARLEGWRESTANVNIAETLRDFEMRISKLESKLTGAN